jgi:hypothetical protein
MMEDGWYWVRVPTYENWWEVALLQRGLWYRAGVLTARTVESNPFLEIGERIIHQESKS